MTRQTLREQLAEILKDFAEAGVIEPKFDEVDYEIAAQSIIEALNKILPEKKEHEDGCSEGEDDCLCGAEIHNQCVDQIERAINE